MRRILFSSTILIIGCCLATINISAQQAEPERQIPAQIKIERFDWYAEREAAELTAMRNYYRRGLPEGKTSNFPTENSPPQKDSEKFIYRISIRNLSKKTVEAIVWRYKFFNPLTKELAASLEFESRARIKPNKQKTIYAESFSPPVQIIDANLLLLNKNQPFLESATVKSLVFAEVSKKMRKK